MDSPQDVSPSSSTTHPGQHQRALCEALWGMCTEGVLCDAVLQVGGEQLRAHRVVLSACSPYLKQRCVNPDSLTPCGSVSIHIDSYSYKVCLAAIEYLYTGRGELLQQQELREQFNQLCQEWELLSLPLGGGSSLVHSFCPDSKTHSTTTPPKGTPIILADEPGLQTENFLEKNASDPPKAVMSRPARGRRRKCKHVNMSPKRSKQTSNSKQKLRPSPLAANNLESKEGDRHSDHQDEANTSVIEIKPYENKDSNCDKSCDNYDDNADDSKSVDDNANDHIEDNKPQNDNTHVGSEADNINDGKRGKLKTKPKTMVPKKKRKVWCAVCSKRFPDSNLLQLHNMEQHWEEGMKLAKQYLCTEAGCSFSSFIYATWHKHKSLHNAEPRVCEVCGKTLKNEFTLKQHVENMHTRSTAYPCQLCDKTFSTKGNLKAHTEARHTDQTTREKLVCPQCAFVCWCKPSMSEHILLKHNELMPARNLHQCESCDFKTTIRTKMKEHMRAHSFVERLACPVCGKTYKSAKLLNRHKKIHDNTAKVTKCLYCDYTTLHGVGTLSNHLRFKHKDKDPKPWRCDECPHKAISKESLTHHLQSAHMRHYDTYSNTPPTHPATDSTLSDNNPGEQTRAEQNPALPTSSSEHVATEQTQAEVESTASSGPTNHLVAVQIPVSLSQQPEVATSMGASIPGLLPGGLLNTHAQTLYSPGSLVTGAPQGYTPLPQGYMHHDGLLSPMYVHNMGF